MTRMSGRIKTDISSHVRIMVLRIGKDSCGITIDFVTYNY